MNEPKSLAVPGVPRRLNVFQVKRHWNGSKQSREGGGGGGGVGGGRVVVVVIESGVTECELKAIVSTAINNTLFCSCKTSFWGSRCAGPIMRFTIKFPFLWQQMFGARFTSCPFCGNSHVSVGPKRFTSFPFCGHSRVSVGPKRFASFPFCGKSHVWGLSAL